MALLTSRRERAAVHSALLPTPEPRATRQMRSRAPAFTSTVTTKSRKRDVGQGGEVHVAHRLGELVGDRRRHGVARREERGGDLVPVPDQHGHGHRLAQRAAQAEDDGADDAGAGVGQHGGDHRLPPGRAERQRGLPLGVGHREQHLPGDRHDVRHHHDREDDPGGEHGGPVDRPLEQRQEAEARPGGTERRVVRRIGISTKMPQSP